MAVATTLEDDPLARCLAEGGAVVAGSVAIGATLGYVAGAIVSDLGGPADPARWVEISGRAGGVFGLFYLIYRTPEVS
jgi:hypothetical protein